MLTGEGYTCNAVTHVITHPFSEHEEISMHVLVDGKCGIGGEGGGDSLCCSQRG